MQQYASTLTQQKNSTRLSKSTKRLFSSSSRKYALCATLETRWQHLPGSMSLFFLMTPRILPNTPARRQAYTVTTYMEGSDPFIQRQSGRGKVECPHFLQLMETTASLKRPPRNEIRSFLEAKLMSNQSLDAFTFRTCVYFWPGRTYFLGFLHETSQRVLHPSANQTQEHSRPARQGEVE